MHNNIMAAGSRDRPPMLATGRYAQWRSRFLRYIDTRPNGDALRKCILKGPYTPTIVTTPAVPATEDSPAVPEQTTVETVMNMTPENRAHFESEKEAIHLILTGIGDEIYSTVDACQTAQEMWEAIERLQQAKPITPPSESASEEDSDPEQAQKDKDMQKNLALIAKVLQETVQNLPHQLRTSSNTINKNVNTTLRYKNDNQTGQFGNQRAVNVVRARETVGGLVVQQFGIQCFNCKEFGHYQRMQKPKTEVPNADSGTDAEPLEQVQYDTNDNVFANDIQLFDQSESISNTCVVETECDDERVALANLIANLKLDVDENKKIQKQLKKANATLTQELTECKSILAETSRTLGESNSIQDTWVKTIQTTLLSSFATPTAKDIEILVKTILDALDLKTQNDSFAFVHELKQEMHADLKYVESLEDELESDKAEFSNMYDMLLQECVSKDVMCSYLQSSSDLDEITELQCLYLHKVRECDCLAQKLSEQTEFNVKNNCKKGGHNKNIAISELKKLIEKCNGKSVDTKFDKPSVVRQPNAQRIPKPSVLGKPTPFSNSLERINFAKKKSVSKTNESEGLSKPVTPQNLPKTATQAVRNTNVIKPGMYRIASSTTQTRAPQLTQTSRNTNPRMSTSTGVAHRTNVSRPQPRSNQMKDKVLPNTSQVKFKKTEVEDHPRIYRISNQTKSVTACNDSLNSRTSNVNVVCATCGKCVFNLNHDACVSKYLNDVNARTKKPKVVPISSRKPKSQANKSVATPHKKTVASESQIQRVTIGCCIRRLIRRGNGG
ncbi:hypothetical protein Tco_0290268 [Tanacetum coccineum]